jgi:hypothetical protein
VVAAVVAILGVGWFVAAQRVLLGGAGPSLEQRSVNEAAAVLEYHRSLVQAHLRAECQLLSEDPRLKSTLAVPNIDEGTISDVLGDLKTQSGLKLIAALTPQARVRAVLGGDQYRGLDLSTSSVVKDATANEGAVPGTWVAGDRLVDVGVAALRVGDRIVGYLVIGATLEAPTLERVHAITGGAAAVLIERSVAVAHPPDLAPMFGSLSSAPTGMGAASLGGREYATRVEVLPGIIPPVRLAFAAARAPAAPLTALVWTPLAVSVLAALAIAARALLRRS